MSEPAFVALLKVHLHFPDVGSLKGKRSELNSVKAGLRTKLGASVAEVAYQDTWQRSTLAVSVAERSYKRCDEEADAILRFLDSRFPQGVRVERVIASWSDLESIG
jgi:uncharacterized protein YlxP (DUF503 family)